MVTLKWFVGTLVSSPTSTRGAWDTHESHGGPSRAPTRPRAVRFGGATPVSQTGPVSGGTVRDGSGGVPGPVFAEVGTSRTGVFAFSETSIVVFCQGRRRAGGGGFVCVCV